MDVSIITIFVLCDEYLQACKHQEDAQCKVSDAEVMTTGDHLSPVFSRQFREDHQPIEDEWYDPYSSVS